MPGYDRQMPAENAELDTPGPACPSSGLSQLGQARCRVLAERVNELSKPGLAHGRWCLAKGKSPSFPSEETQGHGDGALSCFKDLKLIEFLLECCSDCDHPAPEISAVELLAAPDFLQSPAALPLSGLSPTCTGHNLSTCVG